MESQPNKTSIIAKELEEILDKHPGLSAADLMIALCDFLGHSFTKDDQFFSFFQENLYKWSIYHAVISASGKDNHPV